MEMKNKKQTVIKLTENQIVDAVNMVLAKFLTNLKTLNNHKYLDEKGQLFFYNHPPKIK